MTKIKYPFPQKIEFIPIKKLFSEDARFSYSNYNKKIRSGIRYGLLYLDKHSSLRRKFVKNAKQPSPITPIREYSILMDIISNGIHGFDNGNQSYIIMSSIYYVLAKGWTAYVEYLRGLRKNNMEFPL